MTSSLRRKILDRDNFTCQLCGNSNKSEPNLLLEIDHIIPLAKGGITTEDNLQVLCWKCNRSKGAKIPENIKINNLICNTKKQEIICNNFHDLTNDIPEIDSNKNALDIFGESNNKDMYDFTIEDRKKDVKKKEIPIENSQVQKEKVKMYDKEKGIYPSGRYLIGKDLPLGGYLFKAKEGKSGSVVLYRSYKDCINEEDEIFWDSFSDDYFISLVEDGQYIFVENADIKRM